MTTVTIDGANISFNGIKLEDLLTQVYNKGKEDATNESQADKVTFVKLSKELMVMGRKISVRTLTSKAREANIKVFQFDGKRLACKRSDIKHFLNS